MKINDLKRPELTEGFIDNFIAKVKNMAGNDGPTGVFRALRGQNAALNKFADVISNEATPKVTDRLGNQAQGIDAGSATTPVGMILKQAELIGSLLAKKENIDISPAEIQSAISTNKDDILKMLLVSDETEDAIVKSLFNAVVLRSPNVRLRNSLAASIRTISLIVAGTIIFIQTQQEDAETAFDEAGLAAFNNAGAEINKLLFTQNSPDLASLKPNEDLKDNFENLIINVLTAIKNKFLNLTPEQYATAATNPLALINPSMMVNLLSSHSPDVDQAAVAAVNEKLTPMINQQFAAWVALAATEPTTGHPKAYELYKDWAQNALALKDNLNVAAPTAATAPAAEPAAPAAPVPGKPVPIASVEPITIGGTKYIKTNLGWVEEKTSKPAPPRLNDAIEAASAANSEAPAA